MISKKTGCPHCRSMARRVACVRCHREMCEECISILTTTGKVCGLCYDHLTEENEDNRTAKSKPAND